MTESYARKDINVVRGNDVDITIRMAGNLTAAAGYGWVFAAAPKGAAIITRSLGSGVTATF